jgi:hypothetical protein
MTTEDFQSRAEGMTNLRVGECSHIYGVRSGQRHERDCCKPEQRSHCGLVEVVLYYASFNWSASTRLQKMLRHSISTASLK